MNDLASRVAVSIRSHKLVRRGESVLVGVSGGLDSSVLLSVLHGLAGPLNWGLVVGHFNHRLRGTESDGDERFVKAMANRLGLPFVVERGDVKGLARRSSISVEMAARQLRHDFFARMARDRKIRTVALAHHADDQVELFFLRLFRGAGGEGLAGMKWRGPAPFDRNLRLVRPLLDVRKDQLAAHANRQGIAFRQDASNDSPDHLRNRVRHELLPVILRIFGPEAISAILQSMTIVGAETEYVAAAAKRWLTDGRTEPFDHLPIAVQRHCLLLQMRQMNIAPKFDLIESLRQSDRKPVMTSPEHALIRNEAGEICLQRDRRTRFGAGETSVDLGVKPGRATFSGVVFRWNTERVQSPAVAPQEKKRPECEYFDAAKLGDSIWLRHWRKGDRYQPIGMRQEVKLQDAFVNQKIPRARRHELVVATTAAGRVFWVEGLRISEEFKLDKHTASRLKWQWSRQSPVAL